MNMATRRASEALRRILADADYEEAGPSQAFMAAGQGLDAGPSRGEIAAAIKKLEEAEAANASGPVMQAIAGILTALK